MDACFLPITALWFKVLLVVLVLWDSVWKLLAMWKAAQKKEVVWFILLAVINTVGLLPIAYLIINRPCKTKNQ